MTKPHPHGLYAKYFTPEEIAKLESTPREQFLDEIKIKMLRVAVEMLRCRELPLHKRLTLINLIRTLSRKERP